MKLRDVSAQDHTQPPLPFPDRSAHGHTPSQVYARLLLDPQEEPGKPETVTVEIAPTFDCPDAEYITTSARLAEILPELLEQPVIAMDTETTGLDPCTAQLRLVQIATPTRIAVIEATACNLQLLHPLFDGNRKVIFQNAKFDLKFLARAGIEITDGRRLFDTMLAAQLLSAGTVEGRHCGLDALAARYLGLFLDKTLQESDWTGSLSATQIAYAARDAAVLLPLAEKLETELIAANLEWAAEIEMRACPALSWMELAGAPLDAERWQEQITAELERTKELERQLTFMIGKQVNWQSPRQVQAVLQARGHAISNTHENTLLPLREQDALVAALLQYREAARRAGTYGEGWIADHVHAVTGRVHADFLQIGAPSGRMACIRPNLQNIPRSAVYRRCIRPADDHVLIKADFSQIELRLAAIIAQDTAMLHAYCQSEDLHVKTAAAVLGVSMPMVTKEQRQLAKSLNFGLIYGMGAKRLQGYAASHYGVSLTEEAARRYKGRFFRTYQGLRLWHQRTGDQLENVGTIEVRTLTGRRQLGISSFPIALNTPVQGTGADGLKLALAYLYEHRADAPEVQVIATVHDEILAECPLEQAEETASWLRQHMVAAMTAIVATQVPIVADTTIGLDWAGTSVSTATERGKEHIKTAGVEVGEQRTTQESFW